MTEPNKMRALYSIRNDIMDAIYHSMSDEESENPPPPLEDLEIEVEEKVKNCVLAINSINGEIAEAIPMLKTITDYINKRKKAVEYIESDIRLTMEVMLVDKIDDPICQVSLGKAPQVLNILDEDKVPEKHKTHVPECWTCNKNNLKKLVKSGEDIPGVELVDGKRPLKYSKIKL